MPESTKNQARPDKDVFISYSSIDHEFVDKLEKDLRTHNVAVWRDKWDIAYGANIVAEVQRGLRNSALLLVVLSENSLRSRWVESEWTSKFGEEMKKGEITVIPTILGNVEEEQIPELLRGKKRVNLNQNYEEELSAFAQHVLKLRQQRLMGDMIGIRGARAMGLRMGAAMFEPGSAATLAHKVLKKLDMARASFDATRQIALIMREFEYEEISNKESSSEADKNFERDPDAASFAMKMFAHNAFKEVADLRRKLLFVAAQMKDSGETLAELKFELEFEVEEHKNKKDPVPDMIRDLEKKESDIE
jgi:hypothetical protein